MLELLLEIFALLACIVYFYHDYQKAKLEGMNLLDYLRSYVRGFVICVVILILMKIFLD